MEIELPMVVSPSISLYNTSDRNADGSDASTCRWENKMVFLPTGM